VAGPSWSRLALVLLDMGEASGSSSQKPHRYQNLAMQTQQSFTSRKRILKGLMLSNWKGELEKQGYLKRRKFL